MLIHILKVLGRIRKTLAVGKINCGIPPQEGLKVTQASPRVRSQKGLRLALLAGATLAKAFLHLPQQ